MGYTVFGGCSTFLVRKKRPFEQSRDYFYDKAVPDLRKGLEDFNFGISGKAAEQRLEAQIEMFQKFCDELSG